MIQKLCRALLICFVLASGFIFALHANDFNKQLYAERRSQLMEKLDSGILILKNPEMARRTNDVFYYPYRADSDFYYLTGSEEPDAALILLPDEEQKFVLFTKPSNAMSRQWFGEVPGLEGAMTTFGADTAFAIDDFEEKLGNYLPGKKTVHFDLRDEELTRTIQSKTANMRGRKLREMVDLLTVVHEMRTIKSPEEISLIRRAVDITCDAHLEAMKAVQPGMFEYEIGAIFSYVFEKNGAHSKAFESIIASGPNATIFHYSKVDRQTRVGDMLMLDMGAEVQNYTSDVTRSYPVNGKFTERQKEIYEIVVEMEDAILAHMKPGNKWFDCLKQAETVAKQRLFQLGLITDKDTRWQHFLYYFPFCGHSLGLDVHDVGDFGRYRAGGRTLEPGMVFAVEPLIYVGANLVDAFKMLVASRMNIPAEEIDKFLEQTKPAFQKYLHIAARIEDDVLITQGGNENLSARLPRTISEIEAAMSQNSYLTRSGN